MTPTDVIRYYGSIRKAADALGIEYATVWNWQKTGKVPPQRQFEIEVRTAGKLQADRAGGADSARVNGCSDIGETLILARR